LMLASYLGYNPRYEANQNTCYDKCGNHFNPSLTKVKCACDFSV